VRDSFASPAINKADVDSLYLSGRVCFFFKRGNKREGVRVRNPKVMEKVDRERERERDLSPLVLS